MTQLYFAERHHTQWGKNKLMEAIYTMLYENTRTLVDEKNLEAFKAEITSKIEAMNRYYSRYNPATIRWQGDKYDKTNLTDWKLFLNGYHQPDMVIRAVLQNFKSV